jgi:hypothetical protein
MLKHWGKWPRGIRWLAGIAVVVLALAFVWVLFVPAADWLARHDVGSAKGPLLQTARDAARGRLLTLGAGLLAAGALLFTARNFTLSRRTFELTEQGQVTDRYTKAIGQLGDEKLDVRIGGIYALERVARDSAIDHPTVMEVLTAFIREHSHEQWPLPKHETDPAPQRETRPDVQAALTAVGRLTIIEPEDKIRHPRPIDLTGAKLVGAKLPHDAYLAEAKLSGVDLAGVDLSYVDLTGADFTATDLHRILADTGLPLAVLATDPSAPDYTAAYFEREDLNGANLTGTFLIGTYLTGAHLMFTALDRANLTDADLIGANLVGAHLTFTALNRANLAGADLTGADLTGADLTGATWPADAPVPEGWKLDTGTGRLERTGSGPGPAGAPHPPGSTA